MQPRVTAVLVARNGAQYLERTLAALAVQVRPPDSTIFVDAGSADGSTDLLIAGRPTQFVRARPGAPFGEAVARAVGEAAPLATENDWLWLLAHDNAPDGDALARLLAAVEIAPSVGVAGPKLMRWDEPDVIANFGETMTTLGASATLVEDELDQAQRDSQVDVLGVAGNGMLIRRQVWASLGGFDPGLPTVDAGLDLSIRARLAGHRVVGVPTARILTAGGPELFGRRSVSGAAANRVHRAAQLHRRLVYSRAVLLPLHWLSLLPIAVVRSVFHVVGKRPTMVPAELVAAVTAAFDRTVGPARRNLRRSRRVGWSAIAPLRMRWAQLREHRAHQRAAGSAPDVASAVPRPGFFTGGGAWAVLIAAVAGLIAFGTLLGSPALAGGALAPLSSTIGEVWSNVGYGWHEIGFGFFGAADPFVYLIAVLASTTFWSPSLSIVILYFVALPLAALSAWTTAARFAERPWGPVVAALLWAVAPPFLASLTTGHVGSAIAHILLPWLVLATVGAARSWALSGVAALLFAAVVAAAPILLPALLVAWVVYVLVRPKDALRIIGIPLPAAALFLPLVYQQGAEGNWLGILADPGLPYAREGAAGWQIVLGSPDASLNGWPAFVAALGLPPGAAPALMGCLLAPLLVMALLSLFLPGSRFAIPSMLLALLGLGTAVLGLALQPTTAGAATVAVWPGSALSLACLGLLGAFLAAMASIRKRSAIPAVVVGVTGVLLAVPLLSSTALGNSAVQASDGRLLPAFADAEAASRPAIGTLELTAQDDGGISAALHRGEGSTLDEQSTIASSNRPISEDDRRIATLAGNVASRSGFDSASELDALAIAFVIVPDPADNAGAETRKRMAEALDGSHLFVPIGDTDNGFLWHYPALADSAVPPTGPGPTDTPLGVAILVGQAAVIGFALLLAFPTSRARKRSRRAPATASTAVFDEDDDD